MTTAHRPTWKAAVARANQSGNFSMAVSELDAPAHTKLKLRQGPQVVVDRAQILRESLAKLEEAESKAKTKISGRRPVNLAIEQHARQKLLTHTADIDDEALRAKYDDADVVHEGDHDGDDKWDKSDPKSKDGKENEGSDLDASDSEDDDGDDDDDDEDDEAALQAELAKIRAEREAAQAKVQEQAAAEEHSKMSEAALLGNPLLAAGGATILSGKMKRKWNDDVVFRNQAKGEPQAQKRFINDTVRNDFHRRFLNKFIR